MSSLALYRRYRPETFAEVVGQEHVTGPLQQALRNNRVNHAYLFSGPRGCGKTTSARILARCLNCERGPTPDPCGECASCRDLARGGPGSIDVIEIDAASHGGVDDARELREKAFFGPAASRYKIYIIDEAHMVTSAGFNALLKVVEEPPEHLKFIFATTEPDKVIGTIRSRTHHYPFRLVPPGTLRDYLAEVCRREGVPVADEVLPLVVRAGAGSVRDAMSVLDQLLAGAGEEGVTYAMATALLGYTDSALLDGVVDAFAAGDGAAVFQHVDQVIESGCDPRRFAADLLERLRDLVVLASVPDAAEKGLIDAPADVVARMREQAEAFGLAELSRAADLVSEGLTAMRGATAPRLQLELICARVLLPAAYGDERSVQARLDRLERGMAAGALAAGGPAAAPAPAAAPPAAPPATPATPQPAPQAPSAPASQPAPQPAPQPSASPAVPPTSGGQGGPGAATPDRPRPGAWPTGSGPTGAPSPAGARPAPGGAETGGRRPGSWPTATRPPGQPGQAGPAAGAPTGGATAPAPQPAPAAAPQESPAAGAARVQQMWPDILEQVKGRRRFTWILLSQNARVLGFDGATLQLGFTNPGARDSFVNGGSEEVLRTALSEGFGLDWRIEAVVAPAGSEGVAPARPGGGPPPARSGHAPGAAGPTGARPHPQGAGPSAPAGAAGPSEQLRRAASAAPAPTTSTTPPPVAPEDDMPAEDDPDLEDAVLTGHELIARELGATVIEEITHES